MASGTIPAGASNDVNSLFSSLLELRWKNIPIPVGSLKTELRQDLAIHKFVDRDGAHIEGTGRAPLQFTGHIPLLNGLTPGTNETWASPLYPTTLLALLRACADKTSGPLQHPELGVITCKCSTLAWTLEAQVRSGVWGEISWLETDDTGNDLNNSLQQTPTASAQTASSDLDDNLAAVDPTLFPTPYVPPYTFGDLMFAIRGVFDQTTLNQKAFAGRIDNFIYQCNQLETSANAVGNVSALNWPLFDAAERAKAALYDLKASQLLGPRPTANFTTQKDSTLCQIANDIGANVADIMILNPAYVQSPVIYAGSVVRYYSA